MTVAKWRATASVSLVNSAQRAKALSLLRGLLRECTYLPDPASREYMKKHILERYRAYQPKFNARKQVSALPPETRVTTVTRTARRAFAQLRKANDGHMDQLMKVLYMTYGRTGKRRYDLLKPVIGDTWDPVKLEMPEKGPKPLIQSKLEKRFSSIKPETLTSIPKVTPAFEALLRSQFETRPTGAPRHMPKTLNVDLPELNSWLKPMPQVRIKNKAKAWYWDMLSRTLPPLPQHEWHELRKLAHGVRRWDGVVERRLMQGRGQGDVSNADVAVDRAGVSEQDRKHERNYSTLSYEIESPKHSSPRRFLKVTRPHAITPRFMRHLYQKVFQLCPLMTHNSQTGSYKIRWGTAEPEGVSHTTLQTRRMNKSLLSVLEGEPEGYSKADSLNIK